MSGHFAGRSTSGKGLSEPCEEDCWHDDGPAAVVQICLAQLSRKWPSVRVACLLEGSVSLSPCVWYLCCNECAPCPCQRIWRVSRGAREGVLVFIPCALAMGVSKHHFMHWPLSPHSRVARREILSFFSRNSEYSGRLVGLHLITLQQLWQLQHESITFNAYVWLFSQIHFPAQ